MFFLVYGNRSILKLHFSNTFITPSKVFYDKEAGGICYMSPTPLHNYDI